jgi:microcompartment protein CcmK/EutM
VPSEGNEPLDLALLRLNSLIVEAGVSVRVIGDRPLVIIAADEIGAGFEEMVIVTRGAPAMQAFSKEKLIPIDAVVIGIVDNLEMANEAADRKK